MLYLKVISILFNKNQFLDRTTIMVITVKSPPQLKFLHYDTQIELRNAVPLLHVHNSHFLVVNNVVLLFSIESR